MTTLIHDVDGPEHKASFSWRATEASKVKRLLTAYPGAVVFNTKNGYRIVQRLAVHVTLRDHEDAAAWTALYLGTCDALRKDFGIEADTACADWTHCFRLPKVMRDGERTKPGKFDASRLNAVGYDIKSVTPRALAPSRAVAANDTEVSDLPPAPRACVLDYVAYLKGRPDKECDGVGQHNARYTYCFEGAKRGLNADQIEAAMLVNYLPRHTNVETSDEQLHTLTLNALSKVHGDNELRNQARGHATLLRWGARREQRRQKRFWEAKIARWKSEAEAKATVESKLANDTDDPFAALGTDPGIDSAYEPTDWLIEGLQLAPGKMSLVTAYAGGSKTPFAALTSLCVASGQDLLGRKVRRERVLYMAFEGGRNARRKMVRIGKGLGLDVRKLIADGWLTVLDANALDPDTATELVERAITCKRLGLVVTDTVTSALRGVDAARNEERYARLLFDLGNVSERTGCTILGLAHDNKSASGSNSRGVSGTSSILEAAQVVIRLEPSDDPCKIKVTCVRALDTPFDAFHVRWVDGTEDQTTGQAMLPITIDTPLRCVLDAAPSAEVVTARKRMTDNTRRAVEKRQAVERTVKRVVVTLVTEGSARLSDLQRAAGDVSKRVFDEAISQLKDWGAIVKMYDQARLTDEWVEMTPEQIEGQLLARAEIDRSTHALH